MSILNNLQVGSLIQGVNYTLWKQMVFFGVRRLYLSCCYAPPHSKVSDLTVSGLHHSDAHFFCGLAGIFEASCREIGDKEGLIGSDCFWCSSERIDSRNSVQVSDSVTEATELATNGCLKQSSIFSFAGSLIQWENYCMPPPIIFWRMFLRSRYGAVLWT